MNRKITTFQAGALAIASLCLVAGCATEQPGTDSPAEPTARAKAQSEPAKAPSIRRKRTRRRDVALKIGQMAPDFELYTLDHALRIKSNLAPKVRLSSFRGKRPVYLIFASYT